jgi:glycosyltransferase involved in cell wall biosynthesis
MKFSIVVANHGRDLTELKKSIPCDEDVELIVIDEGKERSWQRNKGIKKAKGDAILLLDSDQSISPDLIAEARELLQSGYNALYIPEIIVADGFFAKVRRFEREFYTGTRVDVPRIVMRKGCPLFDLSMSGPEDSDWGNRMKGPIGVTKNVLYHHDQISLREYLKKKKYYAKSMECYRRKWPDDPVLQFRYRCWTIFTEKGKWRKLIRHPILAFSIFIIIILRGIIYVKRPKA